MDGKGSALLPLATGFRLRAMKVRCGCGVMPRGDEWRCQQKRSNGVSLQDEVACLDSSLTKNSLKEVGRCLIDLSTMSHGSTDVLC
jgi:hypothetical protein